MTLHQEIDEMLLNNRQGWASIEKAHTMASAVVAMGGGTICEIGVYTGRGFISMALAVKHMENGLAIAIDPFDPVASTEDEDEIHAEWWKNLDHSKIEHTFLEKLWECDLSEWTKIEKKRSDDVTPPGELTVCHIDGNHREQAIRDVQRFASKVILGGFLFLDDVHWSGDAVQGAYDSAKALGFVERRRLVGREAGSIYENDWCMMQRIKILDTPTAS